MFVQTAELRYVVFVQTTALRCVVFVQTAALGPRASGARPAGSL